MPKGTERVKEVRGKCAEEIQQKYRMRYAESTGRIRELEYWVSTIGAEGTSSNNPGRVHSVVNINLIERALKCDHSLKN